MTYNEDYFDTKAKDIKLNKIGKYAYSLGNIITWSQNGQKGNLTKLVEHHKEYYPGTLACNIIEYVEECVKTRAPIQLVKHFFDYEHNNNDICVHMRLGDCSIARRVVTKTGHHYHENPVNTPKFKETVLRLNKLFPESNICFVTGIHDYSNLIKNTYKLPNRPGQGTYESTINTLVDISEFAKHNKLPVKFRINEHPDEDFMYMLQCKALVTTYGSFGRYIREFRAQNSIGSYDVSLGPRDTER